MQNKNLHIADMLLHILFTICDGLNVGSSTTSTISAPRGSSSTSILATGNGGGGGGATISAGTEVTLFKGLGLFSLLLLMCGETVDFGGEECLALNLGFSMSGISSEVVVDGVVEDRTLSDGDFCCGFLSIWNKGDIL